MNTKEFWNYIFGTGPTEFLIAALVWAYVGAFVMMLINTTKRDPASPTSPFCFKWSYFFSDNSKRILANVILIFIAVRFSSEFLGAKLTMYVALIIGLGFDRLVQLAKDKGLLGPDKDVTK